MYTDFHINTEKEGTDMIRRNNEMQHAEATGMRGGDGTIAAVHHLAKEEVPHGRLFTTFTVPRGASIGYHDHTGETEYYLITSGKGIVTEEDGDKEVAAGDLVITGGGAGHSIRNEADEPLVFVAVILFD